MKPDLYPTRVELLRPFAAGSVGVELGVATGDFSAELLGLGVKTLHLVDCWHHQPGEYEWDPADVDEGGQESRHRAVLARFEGEVASGRVQVHREFSRDAVRHFRDMDWVYVDAAHMFDSVFEDLRLWSEVVRPGGSIFGHDYASHPASIQNRFQVVEAVTLFCHCCGWELAALTSTEEWPSYRLVRSA